MRSLSLAATDAFLRALVYLRDPFLPATSFYRRRHWRQSLAPIKAVAHVRDSAHGSLADERADLHRPYCCALKSQSKFHIDPLRDWSMALRVRDSTMRPDNRSRTWSRSDAYVASLSIGTGMSSKLHAKQAAWIRKIRGLRIQREARSEKVYIYLVSISNFENMSWEIRGIYLSAWETASCAWFGRKVTFL